MNKKECAKQYASLMHKKCEELHGHKCTISDMAKEEKTKEYIRKTYNCKDCIFYKDCMYGIGNNDVKEYNCRALDEAESFESGWDEALRDILVDASKELPEYDIDVWVINEKGEQFYCHRSENKRVKAYKDGWCNYTGSDIIAWIRPISFEEMLKLNEDVLKRLKDK